MSDSVPEQEARADMGAVLGSPLSATVGAVRAPVVAGGPLTSGGFQPRQEPIVVGDDWSDNLDAHRRRLVREAFEGTNANGYLRRAFMDVFPEELRVVPGPDPVRPPIHVNDSTTLLGAVREMQAAKQVFQVGGRQNVLDPLVDLEDLDGWIRASELKQKALQLDDQTMARNAILRISQGLLLQVDTAAGDAVVYSWEALKTALRTLTSGAHPLIAAGMEFLREAEKSREGRLTTEAAFEAGKGRVKTFLREIKNEFPLVFSDDALEKLEHCLLVPYIMSTMPSRLVPAMRLDAPFASKDPSLDLMRTVRRFTSHMEKRKPPPTPKERILATFKSDSKPMKCYGCGEMGHFVAKCPSKKRKCIEVGASHDFVQERRRKRMRSPSSTRTKGSPAELLPPKGRMRVHDMVRVLLCINEKPVTALVDTCSTISLVDVSFVKQVGWEHLVTGEGCIVSGSIPGASDRTLGVLREQ